MNFVHPNNATEIGLTVDQNTKSTDLRKSFKSSYFSLFIKPWTVMGHIITIPNLVDISSALFILSSMYTHTEFSMWIWGPEMSTIFGLQTITSATAARSKWLLTMVTFGKEYSLHVASIIFTIQMWFLSQNLWFEYFIKINLKGDPSQYQPAPATPTTEAANSQSGAPQFFNPTQFGANPPAMPTS